MPLPRSRSEAEAHLPGKSLIELDPIWRNDMAAVRPTKGQAFTPEQKAMMRGFYLIVPPEKLQEFMDLQASSTIRIEPVELEGVLLIGADISTDTRPGENFAKLALFVSTFKFVLVPDSAWPTPSLP